MQVLIVEDEVPAFRRLQKLLEDIEPSIEIIEVIDSVEMAIKWFNNHSLPDLVFMDIQLADGLSFDIFEQIEIKTPVVFTTAYDEYTLKAFKVNSIDYLLKPIDQDELNCSLQKFKNLRAQFGNHTPYPDLQSLREIFQPKEEKSYKARFLVKLGDRLISVPETEIAYFGTEDKIVFLFTQNGKKYAVDYSLDELEGLLHPDCFFRLNRQFIARVEAISKINQYFKGKLKIILNPTTDAEVIVSRERSSAFKNWLDR